MALDEELLQVNGLLARCRRTSPRAVGAQPPGGDVVRERGVEQLADIVDQLADVGSTWDARLRRIKSIAEAIQTAKQQ